MPRQASYTPASPYAPITLRGPSASLNQHGTDLGPAQSDAASPVDPSDPSDPMAATRTLGSGALNPRSMTAPLVTIGSSLMLVLGLFGGFVWVSRKAQRGRSMGRSVPDEVLRVLGQKQLGSLGTVSLVRCGRCVIVVSQSASGIESLGMITDEAEVRHLEAACQGESTASFQSVLNDIEREPAGRGFLGDGIAQPHARKKLFAQA